MTTTEKQIRRMIEAGFSYLYKKPFDMTFITSNGYSRFHAAALDILNNAPLEVFLNRFFGYPLSRSLEGTDCAEYLAMREAMISSVKGVYDDR